MHDTSYLSGKAFSLAYTKHMNKEHVVYDIGGADVNGSIKNFFNHMTYKCVDMQSANGVDYIIDPAKPYPFPENSVDIILSSSCFEHDPCFWITFKEMCRILKPGGYMYISAPSNGDYHMNPGDSWRFYPDAAQSLAYWSNKEYNGRIDRVVLEETFTILPINDIWNDFVAVFRKMDELTTEFVTPYSTINKIGPMKQICIDSGLRCVWVSE
jgi:SAM-dependent methyltransferase